MVSPLAPTQALGAPLFGSFGLMTPEQLALQQQQSQQAQLTDLINNSQSGAGAATGFHLRNLIQGAVDKHYGRVDPQEQAAGQNQHILDIIQQASGGDPDKALEIAAKIGIPQAVEMYQKKQLQDAQIANQQSEASNRTADNARADAADQRAQVEADRAAKENTWTKLQSGPGGDVYVNGLGKPMHVPSTATASGAGEDIAVTHPERFNDLVKSIANYDQPMPTPRFAKSLGTDWTTLNSAVIEASGGKYSATGFNARKNITTGPDSNFLRYQNTAARHMEQYKEASDAFRGGNTQLGSKILAGLSNQLGATGAQTLDTIAGVLSKEVVKALVPNAGSAKERLDQEARLAPQLVKAQREGNLDAFQGLIYGQRQGIKDKFVAGSPGIDPAKFDEIFPMAPQLQAWVDKHPATSASAGGANSAPPQALEYLKAHPETAEQFKAKFGYLPSGG